MGKQGKGTKFESSAALKIYFELSQSVFNLAVIQFCKLLKVDSQNIYFNGYFY